MLIAEKVVSVKGGSFIFMSSSYAEAGTNLRSVAWSCLAEYIRVPELLPELRELILDIYN
jgi:hypothetical protein